MKLKTRTIYLALITFLLLIPHYAYSETSKSTSVFDTENGKINISSISYEVDMKTSIATFKGDVLVEGNDMNISCQKLELFMKKSPENASSDISESRIDRIVASESVVITRPDKGSASAEKAVYYHDSQKVVLTGNPSVNDGDRFQGGGKVITLYLDEDRYVVEGTKKDRARLFSTGKEER